MVCLLRDKYFVFQTGTERTKSSSTVPHAYQPGTNGMCVSDMLYAA